MEEIRSILHAHGCCDPRFEFESRCSHSAQQEETEAVASSERLRQPPGRVKEKRGGETEEADRPCLPIGKTNGLVVA